MAKHIIDASRAGEVLDEFLWRWNFELTDDIAGTVLEFLLNRNADALCRRLAEDPELGIKAVPRGVQTLLASRILLFLANSAQEPMRRSWRAKGRGATRRFMLESGIRSPRRGCRASGMGSRSIRGRASEAAMWSTASTWSHWPSQPLDPTRHSVIERFQGDEQGPPDGPPRRAMIGAKLAEEAAGRRCRRVVAAGAIVVTTRGLELSDSPSDLWSNLSTANYGG